MTAAQTRPFLLAAALAAGLAASLAAQQDDPPPHCGYPERNILSPFREPADVYAPPDELFRQLRLMQNLAARFPDKVSFDADGREVVDLEAWREARLKVAELGLNAGQLAQMMRLHRDTGQRETAFYAFAYVPEVDYALELISHIPGEPVRGIREAAFPRAVEYLRRHLKTRFGDLSTEQKEAVIGSMPEPGSPVARSRGITRAPIDADHLHTINLVPFFQMLDCKAAIDRAQALWFLDEVFQQRLDLALVWLEPVLPRIRYLLLHDEPEVSERAAKLLRNIGPKDLPEPPTEREALREWAIAAEKGLFPPIRNLNDAIVQLHPSPERDAIVAAGLAALANSSIGDPFRGQNKEGQWYAGYRIARVPDELRELAIPKEAVITTVNGIATPDARTLLDTVRSITAAPRRPIRLTVEYMLDGKPHAVEYRVM